MRSVNIQFHMLFEELIAFVTEASSRYLVQAELERFYPKGVREVPFGANLTEEIRQFGQVDRFWLLYTPPRCRKAERFMLNIGRQKNNQLDQSQLGAGARTEAGYKVLKQVASELKRRTTAGVWVIAANGYVGYVKTFRISEGAAHAERTGKLELTQGGTTQSFHVNPPKDCEEQ